MSYHFSLFYYIVQLTNDVILKQILSFLTLTELNMNHIRVNSGYYIQNREETLANPLIKILFTFFVKYSFSASNKMYYFH
jgi:hypothetical protein